MTKMILVRHAEPDYQVCHEKGMTGFYEILAPLSEAGVIQAEQLAHNPVLDGAELIVSSPYTRSLQTAAILSRATNLPIDIHIDLHEWGEDKDFHYVSPSLMRQYHQEFISHKGRYPENEQRNWETLDEMGTRIIEALKQYQQYTKIIVVSHGGVMKRLVHRAKIAFCGYEEIDFHENYTYKRWTD